ncbi:MAG TPA: SDR family NAD(P)-dependent oxidoreductase [Chthonomonadaceae bacterium]|nr:SDR family NAD(P)-dependent oxidoreductase [Chthonomonadaceae bacterium]
MYPELSGKVAIISGAGGSLGRAVARRLHAENVRLALIDQREEALRKVSAELGLQQGSVLIGALDLTQKAAVDAFVAQAAATFGRIDILANIAGGFAFSGPVHEMDMGDLDAMLSINTKTAFLLSAAVARAMVGAKTKGRIINVGARAALSGPAGIAAYSASKAAVLRLTESMAAELLEHGITVNAVLPSVIDTPANRQAMADADFSKWVAPESLADVIAFLASDSARDISGASLPVYGRA